MSSKKKISASAIEKKELILACAGGKKRTLLISLMCWLKNEGTIKFNTKMTVEL